ncbi:MAG: ribosome silencing factor [Dolichospermum sp. LBC05a]|jgi:ribosome-associated protein|uniref:Ribosomal silencing factor RsfS n=1 Tax=Dolichospermum flos-aquae CCAP 1403/13F TaxID=315271 RepID=A0A6H2C5Z9_DOLFA|nr:MULTISPECIES: ribosome silencing factor [Dolichospermum]MBO1053657.1 ribosome silencing factor [Dolichospermum sp. DET73]MBS9393056.1 ribosome silencing factor [Dolichospermum sp. OL01]MCO5796692.1 ribosome silencing factor [Dolichospermum sp. OL03]MCS6280044.1 ribosome silencing factor [Dolichospermum sp.]QSV58280.1 MAG: ribosome silencing factor [Dolichospermum sp. LBC05a]
MTESFPRNLPLTINPVSRPKTDTEATSKNLALTIAEAALDRKAVEIILLNVAEISSLADYFVMMTGYSKVQVRAIADAIQGQVEIDWQRRPIRTEGKAEGTWVLQDYGDVIVHIMMPREREFYNLEAFWGHAERISLPNAENVGS